MFQVKNSPTETRIIVIYNKISLAKKLIKASLLSESSIIKLNMLFFFFFPNELIASSITWLHLSILHLVLHMVLHYNLH